MNCRVVCALVCALVCAAGVLGGCTSDPTLTESLPPIKTTTTAAATTTTTVVNQYVVVEGDSLSSIAKRFDVSSAALAAYNRLADPDVIDLGQVLMIPPAESTATSGAQLHSAP